ncbi:phage tail fiber protein [Mesorhizobium sp. M1252]|uniref:phage tail fiber domain-containing protein n=1 Tax=Mesorhizobium sp. M1252 TaxID=2957073 RepID=UPI003337E29C
MANSYVFYPSATGSTTDYSVPFEYLSQTFVKATVNGASVPFTFLSTYMIRFTTAPVGALKIYRQTSKAPVNTYINGSILVDSQLNGSFLQSLHVSEEVADNAMQVAADGSWDATNLKVKNVATPTVGNDATNKTYVDTRFDADKVAVDASKTAAAASAAAALASQGAAATSATNAATSKTGADTAKAGADTAKAGADTAKTGADASKVAAQTAQTAAETARDLAQKWATEVEDTPVSGGQFSAFHWARKAMGYVTGSIANAIHGATSKASPAGADELALVDSAASWGLKKLSITDLVTNILAVARTFASNLNINGLLTVGIANSAGQLTASGASVELGSGRTVDGVSYIDFHGAALATDFEARIIRNPGVNGTFIISQTGTGDFQLTGGGNLSWNGGQILPIGSNDARYLQSSTAKLQKFYESAAQTITVSGPLTLAHGLGVKPVLYFGFIKCLTAEGGYSVGDEVMVNVNNHDTGTGGTNATIVPDATNLNVRFGNNTWVFAVINKTSAGRFNITPANWQYVVRAFA